MNMEFSLIQKMLRRSKRAFVCSFLVAFLFTTPDWPIRYAQCVEWGNGVGICDSFIKQRLVSSVPSVVEHVITEETLALTKSQPTYNRSTDFQLVLSEWDRFASVLNDHMNLSPMSFLVITDSTSTKLCIRAFNIATHIVQGVTTQKIQSPQASRFSLSSLLSMPFRHGMSLERQLEAINCLPGFCLNQYESVGTRDLFKAWFTLSSRQLMIHEGDIRNIVSSCLLSTGASVKRSVPLHSPNRGLSIKFTSEPTTTSDFDDIIESSVLDKFKHSCVASGFLRVLKQTEYELAVAWNSYDDKTGFFLT